MKRWLSILLGVFSFSALFRPLLAESEWTQLLRGRVILYCHPKDVRNGERIFSIIEKERPKIEQDLGLSSVEKLTVFIASSESEFAALTEEQIPEWGVGAADPLRSVLFLKSPRFNRPEVDLEQVVVHELSHVMLGMVLRGREADRWFDEGFAMYESGEGSLGDAIRLARNVLAGEVLRLDEIDDVLTFRREKAALAYLESRYAVGYLVERFGRQTLKQIAWTLREGKGMDETLLLTLGMGFEEFQSEWYQTLKNKYRWYVFLDMPFVLGTLFVVFFLTAFIMTQRRIRRTKKKWEEEDRYGIERLEKPSSLR